LGTTGNVYFKKKKLCKPDSMGCQKKRREKTEPTRKVSTNNDEKRERRKLNIVGATNRDVERAVRAQQKIFNAQTAGAKRNVRRQ